MASNAKKRKLSEPKINQTRIDSDFFNKNRGVETEKPFTEKTSSKIYEDVRLLKKITSWKLDHKWLVYENNAM